MVRGPKQCDELLNAFSRLTYIPTHQIAELNLHRLCRPDLRDYLVEAETKPKRITFVDFLPLTHCLSISVATLRLFSAFWRISSFHKAEKLKAHYVNSLPR
jgi:hypothetical protein